MSQRKELRPHQQRAIDMLRHSLVAGHRRPMLQLATGAGKTVIAATITRQARAKDKRVCFIVDALSLIDQTVEAFYAEGVHGIGVIQADHPMTDWSKPVQVASVQTLRRRGMPRCDLVIVDEAHSQDEWLKSVMTSEEWAKVPFIGLSATPWSKGLGNFYDDLLIPVSMQELIDAGYLSTFRVFAPAHPDLSGVKTVGGDYHEGQLAEVMNGEALVADVVRTWAERGEGRPTLCFCVDRAHAKKMQARFNEAGIPAGYIDAFTDREERKRVRADLDAGRIRVVCNVGCLTKGVDWAIGCIILARPTKSEMLFVQMVGRGLRVNAGLSDCIILDHSDNTLRMGFPTDIQHLKLCTAKKGDRKPREESAPLPKECPKCTYLKAPKVHECPACGFKPERKSDVEEADGRLVEVAKKPKPAEKSVFFAELLGAAMLKGKGESWALANYRARYNEWPYRKTGVRPIQPSPGTLSYIKSRQIAWAKRRAG